MSNQHTTQHFSLHFWKQSKAKLIVSQGDFYSINKRNIYVFDALSIKDFKFPIGEFSKYPVPDERRVHFHGYYH